MKIYKVILNVQIIEEADAEMHEAPESAEDPFVTRPGEDPLARAGKMLKAYSGRFMLPPGPQQFDHPEQLTLRKVYAACAGNLAELHTIMERFDDLGNSLGMPSNGGQK